MGVSLSSPRFLSNGWGPPHNVRPPLTDKMVNTIGNETCRTSPSWGQEPSPHCGLLRLIPMPRFALGSGYAENPSAADL